MALNKQLYKTPEDKMKAFRIYHDQNCEVCQGCRPTGGQCGPLSILMCFTAWLESEADASFAEGFAREKAKRERERAIIAKRSELGDAWAAEYPTLSKNLDLAILKPPVDEIYREYAKAFSLSLPVFYPVKGADACRSDLAEFNFGKREVRFATALGAKTVKTLLAKTDKDLKKAASKAGVGKAMIKKFSDLIADTRKLAVNRGLVK